MQDLKRQCGGTVTGAGPGFQHIGMPIPALAPESLDLSSRAGSYSDGRASYINMWGLPEIG
jgi:hypothetical protein